MEEEFITTYDIGEEPDILMRISARTGRVVIGPIVGYNITGQVVDSGQRITRYYHGKDEFAATRNAREDGLIDLEVKPRRLN